jgi:hypothetical protein
VLHPHASGKFRGSSSDGRTRPRSGAFALSHRAILTPQITLSVHTLETLFVFAPKQTPERLTIRINVDLSTVLNSWGSLKRLTSQVPGLNAYEGDYDARPDVAGLEMHSVHHAVQMLELPGVVAAARRLNLDLMRKGPTMHWHTHCFDLADVALSLRRG